MEKTYEGWKNYATWNVSLWINNDFGIYTSALDFMKDVNPQEDIYKKFVISQGFAEMTTPDDIDWLDDSLDYAELDEMMKELVA